MSILDLINLNIHRVFFIIQGIRKLNFLVDRRSVYNIVIYNICITFLLKVLKCCTKDATY